MAEAIVSAGGRALVATSGGVLETRVVKAGGEVSILNMESKNPAVMWRNAGFLRDLIVERGVDVVHARSRAPAWSGWAAAKRTGTPFTTTYHGVYAEGLPFKRLYNGVMARGRPVIAVSRFIRDLIVARHRVDARNIAVIPRGADIEVFSDEVVRGGRMAGLMEQWGLLDEVRPIVMLPARLTRWKGAETLIDAAAILKSRKGAEHFVALIVGEETSAGFGEALKRKIIARGVQDCVFMTGGVRDMPAAYKLSAVTVSASTEPEAFGRAIVEAQAMRRPVIATDHGGARETVIDGESGWLYPPGDAEALAAAMERSLDLDAAARARMGEAARRGVLENYTVAEMRRATLAVYERAAGRSFRL